MQIKWQNIDNLIPYERNAKLHPDSQVARIARSIEEFGFRNPVLLDGQGEIIAGHGRILGAKRAGLTEVPTIDASDMTPEQVRAYRIADNKLAESDWSLSALSEELMDLQGLDFDLTLLGFDDDKLTELMVDPENKGLTNPDTVPGTPKTPKTKAGDVWLLDNHRLVCGDCCEFDLVSRLFAGKTARLLLTDPPYNVNYGEKATYLANGRGGQKRNIKNDHMKDEAFAAFLRDVFASCFAVLAPGGGYYVFHADSSGHHFRQAMLDAGFMLKQVIIWVKNAAVMSRQDYHWQHEPVLYGWKPGKKHFWAGGRKKRTVLEDDTLVRFQSHDEGYLVSISDGLRSITLDVPTYEVVSVLQDYDATAIRHDRPRKSADHPTMKPVALLEGLLLNSCAVGDVVFDPFGGSGSTLIACERRKRTCYMVELDPAYCDVIVRRWQEFTGKQAVLEATGQPFDEVGRD